MHRIETRPVPAYERARSRGASLQPRSARAAEERASRSRGADARFPAKTFEVDPVAHERDPLGFEQLALDLGAEACPDADATLGVDHAVPWHVAIRAQRVHCIAHL